MWSNDFVGFTKYLDVLGKEGEVISVQQSPILTMFEKARTGRDVVLKPRQVFMTTWELARDIWFFMTRPGKVIILCQSSAKNDAPKEISQRLVTMFEGLRRNFPSAPFTKTSDTKWVRSDGVKATLEIMGAGATEKSAGKKGRSGTIHRLHVTEVAFFEYAHETLTAILECVPGRSSGTEITFESTPKGAAGFFYERYNIAKGGKSGYKAHFYKWFEQPEYHESLDPDEKIVPETEREKELVNVHKITTEQLKWYRQKVADQGQAKVNQEYPSDEETCWLFDGRVFFDPEALSKLRMGVKPPIDIKLAGAFKVWQKAIVGNEYIFAIDPSGGLGGDPAAAILLEKRTGVHCATLIGQFPPDIFAMHCAAIAWVYNMALIVIERSSSHELMHHTLQNWKRPGSEDIGYPHVHVAQDRKKGFHIGPQNRMGILDGLESAIRTGTFVTHDINFIKEAQLFIVVDDKPQAASGAHDDQIMATAIGWDLLKIPAGLKHTAFAQAPSIAYTQNPAAFEGVHNQPPSIDKLVLNEQKRWAGGSGDGGFSVISSTPGDMDGF